MKHYALITGATSGLGLAYAKWFAGKGYDLIMTFSEGRNASKQNLLVDSADMVRAVIHAAGPGREVTWIPAS